MMEGLVYFPVLDGPDPKGWRPWGQKSFSELKEWFRKNPIDLVELKQYSKVSLDLIDQSRDELFEGSEEKWIRYIGVVVDVRISDPEKRKEVERDLVRILAQVRSSKEAYYRELGFYLLLIVSFVDEVSYSIPEEQIALWRLLEDQVNFSLGEGVAYIRLVPEEGAFVSELHYLNWIIGKRYVRATR